MAACYGLAIASFAAVFTALIPVLATIPIHVNQSVLGFALSALFLSGLGACPIAAILLAFGRGTERILGIATMLFSFGIDMVLAAAAAY